MEYYFSIEQCNLKDELANCIVIMPRLYELAKNAIRSALNS